MNPLHFIILLGGSLTPTPRLERVLADSRIVAADGGMQHAERLGLRPELWVGDFDSTPPALADAYSTVERMPYPAAKALTDGEIAVDAAIARGARTLVLAGAMGGGRSDHALQHLLLAVRLAERGFSVLLTSGEEEAVPLIAPGLSLDLPEDSLFSILAFSDLEGLTLTNCRYPLRDFHLPFGSSRTISNVATGTVHLSLAAGRAIVLARPYDLSGV